MLSPRRHEHGLGVVEVIVAALILAVVATGLVVAASGSSRSNGIARVQSKQLAVAQGTFEWLQTETRWARDPLAKCASMAAADDDFKVECDGALISSWLPTSLTKDAGAARNGLSYKVAIEVTGYDDAVDKQGTKDVDGLRPDYYVARVVVTVPGRSDIKKVDISGVVDPSGRSTRGAITIQACKVTRQYDERIPIGSCPAHRDRLLGLPARGPLEPTCADSDADCKAAESLARTDWTIVLDMAKAEPEHSREWTQMTQGVSPLVTTIKISRVDGEPIDLVPLLLPVACPKPPGLTATSITCSTDDAVTADPSSPTATITIGGLRPGLYDVDTPAVPTGYEVWKHQSVPTGGVAIVEAGKRTRVMKVLKPRRVHKSTPYRVMLHSCDVAWPSAYVCNDRSVRGLSAWMVPAINGRTGWSCEEDCDGKPAFAPAGSASIDFYDLAPGIYIKGLVLPDAGGGPSNEILWPCTAPRAGCGAPARKEAWIDPISEGLGGDDPPSGAGHITQYWCDADRRDAYIASLPSDMRDSVSDCRGGGSGPGPSGGGAGGGGGGA